LEKKKKGRRGGEVKTFKVTGKKTSLEKHDHCLFKTKPNPSWA
jgi:hypothetical protein